MKEKLEKPVNLKGSAAYGEGMNELKTTRQLKWGSVNSDARGLFNVWCLGNELAWAERSWGMMEKAGLTGDTDAVEETHARVRLLALATIYWDFCALGADESFGWDELYYHATEDLGIDPFRLAQVAGAAFEAGDYDLDGSELVEAALRHLVVAERPTIAAVLVEGFGNEGALLSALFATTKEPPTPPDEEHDEPAANDEPDFDTAVRVMSWIAEGMPTL